LLAGEKIPPAPNAIVERQLLFVAGRTDHLYTRHLQIAVLPATDFFGFKGLAFFFLCFRSVGLSASHSNGVADMIGKGDFTVGVKLPVFVVRADEKKSSGFTPFLEATGYGLRPRRFIARHLRCAIQQP